MEIASQITASVSARYPSQKPKAMDDVVSSNNYASRTDTEAAANEKAIGVNRVKEPSQAEKTDPLKDPQREESLKLNELKERDIEVRRHEQAHMSAAGPYAKGGPSFTYQRGPDGRQYAVGGEVKIDMSEVSGDPEATLQKAETIRRAALAPGEPSGQDRAVASEAASMAAQAQSEISEAENSLQSKQQNSADTTTDQPQAALAHQVADHNEAAVRLDKKLSDVGLNPKSSDIVEKNALSIFA